MKQVFTHKDVGLLERFYDGRNKEHGVPDTTDFRFTYRQNTYGVEMLLKPEMLADGVPITLIKVGCHHCKKTMNAGSAMTVLVPRWRGLGDVVADAIHLLTHIKPCAACERRRHWLNVKLPFIGPVLSEVIDDAKDTRYPIRTQVSWQTFDKLVEELRYKKDELTNGC